MRFGKMRRLWVTARGSVHHARALGDLVAEGYFDAATAERAARSILSRDLMSFLEYRAFGSGERCAPVLCPG